MQQQTYFGPTTSSIAISMNENTNTDPDIYRAKKYHWYASRYAQLWIGGVILFLTIINIYRKIHHFYRIRKQTYQSQIISTTTSNSTSTSYKPIPTSPTPLLPKPKPNRQNYNSRIGRGIKTKWRNIMYLTKFPFPTWLYMPETFIDAFWTILYCVVYSYFCIRHTESWFPVTHANAANQFGVMSFSQLPIIIILIQKNNPISALTGITYQKLNYLHRASSRACLLSSWAHALLWTPRVWEAGDTRPYLLWGIAALTGFTLLWLTSFRIVRRVCWEFFIVAHIIFTLLYLIGACYHWERLNYWVWPALAIWILDRFIRGCRTLYINRLTKLKNRESLGECKIELLDHDVLRVTVPRRRFQWSAGQHAFIFAPSISSSIHESHPFSIANIPTEISNEVYFLIRVHNGFTKMLRQKLDSDVTTTIPLYLEGPYGCAHSLDSFSTVVLLAGGTGITFVSSHLLQLLDHARLGKSAVRYIHLVWHIRHAEDIEWIAPLLNEAVIDLPDVNVVVDIYVTKSHASDEPYEPPEDSPHRQSITMADVTPQLNILRALREEDREMPQRARPPVSRLPTQIHTPHESRDEGCQTCVPGTPTIMESSDEFIWLPKPHVVNGRFGLTKEASEIIRWKKGRADLKNLIERDALRTVANGAMNVSVCGPVQLLDAAKTAVREVSNITSKTDDDGDGDGLTIMMPSIDYFEETLGA